MFTSLDLILGWWTWVLVVLAVLGSAVVVALLLEPLWRRRANRSRVLRSRSLAFELALGCVLMTMVPGLWTALAIGEETASTLLRQAGERLSIRSASLAARLERDLALHRAAVESLATNWSGAGRSLPDNADLEIFKAQFPGFLTMLVARPDGVIVARAGKGRIQPSDAQPEGVSDRPYFIEPMRTRLPYVSGVFRGRGFGSDPIVAISAPLIRDDGSIAGIVEGSLDIAAWPRELYSGANEPGSLMLLGDPFLHVVFADGGWQLDALAPLADHPRFARAFRSPGTAVVTDAPGGHDPWITVVQRSASGWYTSVSLPLSQLRAGVARQVWIGGAVLGLGVGVSIAIGVLLAHRTSRTVARLAGAMVQYRPDSRHPAPRTSRSAPVELRRLFVAFHRLRSRWRYALADRDRTIRERDAAVIERTTEIAAKNAALTELNRELQQLVGRDSLTGVANRHAFDERLDALWDAHVRLQIPLAMVLFDIDHFKQLNDCYGHAAGDDCLRRIAGAVTSTLERATDFVARIGGEEFAVLLPGTDVAQAAEIAEGLRVAIELNRLPHADSPFGIVTASFGVASVRPRPGGDRTALAADADAALYAAKANGRNRVELAAVAGAEPATPAREPSDRVT